MSNEPSPAEARDWLLLLLCSPSGAGKTTLKNRLLERFGDLRFSISHTTRPRRAHELDGREYHFVGRDEFERMARAGAFVEWAEVHGNLYGTGFAEVDAAHDGRHRGIVFDVDYQGARQILARRPDAVGVFILPPSFAALEQRLRARADEPEASVVRRLANARRELEHYAFFDYVLVNDRLQESTEALCSIVIAERQRRARRAPEAERVLAEARRARLVGPTGAPPAAGPGAPGAPPKPVPERPRLG
ncbi:MAG TPA: guanylate kinase [Polyangiaceae bacterium]|nr:guanylate kinase [Polyangiaceae bacterium]